MQLAFGGHRVTVTAADLVIGSDPSAALVVEGIGVLPRHALVRVRQDGRTEVAPAVPGALLLLNGARVGNAPRLLEPGDRLVMGDREITALDPEAPAGAAQRLNVTMMGMPAVSPGSLGPRSTPTEVPAAPPAGSPIRRLLLIVGVLAAVVLGDFFLIRG
jgi:hypothetical protein